jgi:TgpA N-terminal domain/Transglutaminase-like superfamily
VTPGRGYSAIPRGGRSLLGSALVAAAACASLLALSGLLIPGRWLRAGMLAVAVLAIITAAVRSAARSRWTPTIVGAITAALGVLVVYGAPPGRVQVLPDGASVERLLASARAAAGLINASVVPMDAARPVEMLVVAGGMLVFLFSDVLALGLDAPAWSGFVLATLWLPAIGLGYPAPASALAWTSLAYLLLLALNATPRGEHAVGARRAASTVAFSAVLVVAALVIGPVVAAAPGWASLTLPNFGSGPIGPLRLSDDLDLRQSLGRRSGQVVLHYTVAPLSATGATSPADSASATPGAAETANARVVGPLRAFTLSDFDGRSWQPTDATDLQDWAPGTLLASDPRVLLRPVDTLQPGTLARVEVTIDGLHEVRLPVSTSPRTVEIAGPWRYDALRDEVVGDRATGVGTTYAMTVEIPNLTADDLKAAVGELPGGLDPYLNVPQTAHTGDIRALATQITAGASGTYEQALALQTYFRDTSRFVYDTRVAPARTTDAVWDFLTSRHGYCVQFATSMAIMARSLGIPARLGVGFLPGVADSNGVYTVTGRLSHAWPELYFPPVGWVRFEPTPAVQSGSPPRWSDPIAFSTAAPNAGEIPNDLPGHVTAGATAGATVPGSSVRAVESTSHLPLFVGAGLLLVLALAGLGLARRRSNREAPLDPEVAWSRLRERLAAASVEWSDARTPRQCVDVVRARVKELRAVPLSEPADDALVHLADAVEQLRYAPAPPTHTPEELASWIAAVLTDVTTPVSDPSRDASASALRDGS